MLVAERVLPQTLHAFQLYYICLASQEAHNLHLRSLNVFTIQKERQRCVPQHGQDG